MITVPDLRSLGYQINKRSILFRQNKKSMGNWVLSFSARLNNNIAWCARQEAQAMTKEELVEKYVKYELEEEG